jgi:hypothetical protein
MLDITTLAAWGEFIGGIAVVVSLIYLASQIRQNSRIQQSSSTAMIVTNGITTNALLTGDPELSRVYFEGIEDRLSLSEPDRRRFDSMIGLIIASFANEYFLWLEDAVSPRVWRAIGVATCSTCSIAGGSNNGGVNGDGNGTKSSGTTWMA